MSLEIFIVDDDDIIIFLHKMMISSELGNLAQPHCFKNGREAIDKITTDAPQNQHHYLILLDINMPVMDGWDFLEAIHTKPFANRIHVIMVTSSINIQDKKRAEKYPQVIHFIEKPLTKDACSQIKNVATIQSFF